MIWIKKKNGTIIGKRNKFKDYFCIKATAQFIYEGYPVPKFYLPVKSRDLDFGNTYECWIFPLAPFVIIFYIWKNCLFNIWKIFIMLTN